MNNEFIEVEVFEVYDDYSIIFETGLDYLPVGRKLRSLGNVTLSTSKIESSELTTHICREYTYDSVIKRDTKRGWIILSRGNETVIENLKAHTREVELYKTTMSSGAEYLTKERLIGVNNGQAS